MRTSTIFNQSINEIGIEETMKREVCKILADVLSDALQSADDDQRDNLSPDKLHKNFIATYSMNYNCDKSPFP